ncbi:Pkinase-domain-containing protein [Stereum hirsutum FP-91666 SS1]|uniref:Pkinase-domain-containing protein n=1 Tax=Stereum hirsutum (strain FP-91666) TaxID=721885 RepID=UPI0004449F78|nr:Pkinase-domain-containing protein [Stereum hirsutum FP-91666 SS1]EIM83509.1 Pkinase-domain-containing protein [Stereum hirsutum FP-91666 SS1]
MFSPQQHVPQHYNNVLVQHHSHSPSTTTSSSSRSLPPHHPHRPAFVAQAVPSVTFTPDGVRYGDAHSTSTRSFTPIKEVGDGSFGTVVLCDWHGQLPPNTPLPAMQAGAGARPDYANKRLAAVKRMKKKWEGGWDECMRLKELEALRAIPIHPNIIPLYDAFLLPQTKELYFVFEPMEGHLFQLIKARKGRPLAGGLVASIFRQIVSGLHHIHASGYFHRDMKPENVLVTTTGLYDYPNLSPVAPPNAPPEKDVVVVIKLADFGLARETKSKPPYTEYVSTRWYRAPEVLLKSKDYSNPVDMWALGTIMAELVNLRPLFPGKGEIDQISKITEILGDPSDEYGYDQRGKSIGGGKWSRGLKMAKAAGLALPKTPPKNFNAMFDHNVPPKLVECIADLLKYDPAARLTSRQCLEHPYLLETAPRITPPQPPLLISTSVPNRTGLPTPVSLNAVSPRNLPPSHSHPSPHPVHIVHLPDQATSHRQSFYASSDAPSPRSEYSSDPHYAHVRHSSQLSDMPPPPPLQHSATFSTVSSYQSMEPSPQIPQSDWNMSPHGEIHEEYVVDGHGHPMEIQTSPVLREYPQRPPIEDPMQDTTNGALHEVTSGTRFPKLGTIKFGGNKPSKWGGLGNMFGGHGDKGQPVAPGLPPVDEHMAASSNSTPSLKRTQSSSTDSRSLPEVEPQREAKDPKKEKKLAEKMAREAERQRRAQAEKSHRQQARAVMEKRNQVIMQNHTKQQLEWKWQHSGSLLNPADAPRPPQADPKHKTASSSGLGVRQQSQASSSLGPSSYDWSRDERMAKARKREYDDDHSMSSSDVQSIGPVSMISFATIDSDPGPSRLAHRPSMLGLNRVTTASSTGFDDFPVSARSSNSLSHEQQLANDFRTRASVAPGGSLSDVGSPPMHALSLSPSHSWQTVHQSPNLTMGHPQPTRLTIPQQGGHPPLPYNGHVHGHTPSPALDAPKSAINPIFKVPSMPSLKRGAPDRPPSVPPPSLPPFAQLEAVAGGEYPPPLSPMSFVMPDEDLDY